MTNMEKYQKAFIEALELNVEELEGLTYQGVSSWDSVGHMGLIAALEEEFDVMLDTDDIIEFSSYIKGVEILAKYNIAL
jgi:acyl carrier protein